MAREDAPEEVLAGLRTSPLAATVGNDADVAQVVLLVLAAPDTSWRGLDACVVAELAAHREALPEPPSAEEARLRAQLDALGGLWPERA